MLTHLKQLPLKPGILICLCLAAGALQSADRVWKDASGQNELRAELVRRTGDNLLLRREDGTIITVPLVSLSPQDQEFIAGTQQANSSMMGEVEITIDLPKPMFISPPVVELPNIELFDPSKRIKSFKALKGTVNVAKGKKVTSSDEAPIIGDLALITDGDADGSDGNFVELMPGKQWVQIDLEATHTLQKIAVWHYHKAAYAYLDVIILASDDPEFKTGVTTLWNSDHDDSSNMGKGKDPAYIETNYGRIIEGKAAKARYVRLWSNGSSANEMNHYIEVQVFAVPVKKAVR
ncbi:MAG: SHD1 domain-containing protein [Prosthecobacter sp.]|uniref:discoidin domain-containing protein n=1 Tax=Prosthecobacter sp. TaxID=1965333 RepID=UPI003BB0A10B